MKINVRDHDVPLSMFHGSISEVIGRLEELQARGITALRYIDGHYDTWPEVEAQRLETDAEEAKRLELEDRLRLKKEQEKAKKVQRERAQYEKLKRKFESQQNSILEK